MSTFVLVHGAFHGAWCWERVTALLVAAGHRVLTVEQRGLGARAHLIEPDITLTQFADDVVEVLESEDLNDVVLVGHSFGGNAISGAADRVPGRIRHLVYLDGSLPQSGVAPLDLALPEIAAERRARAAATGNLSIAPPDPASFGVPDGPDAEWVRQRLTPHPFGSMNTALTLVHPLGNGLPCTYVECTIPSYPGLSWARAMARMQPGWHWRTLATGHDAMVTAPGATASLLMEISS